MAELTLYTYPANFRAFKILIAAEYNGIAIDIPDFAMMKDNKTPEFLAMSPLGKVPVLKTSQGAIFESNAIARYVARIRRDTELYGSTFFESGQVDSWIDFSSHELELALTMWLYPVIGYMPFHPVATEKSKLDVARALKVLEAHLLDKTYLVGNRMSLADITVSTSLVYPMKLLFTAEYRAQYPCIMRWFNTCVNQPEYKAVIGEVVLCVKELLPPGGASAPASTAPTQKPKQDQKPKKEKKAQDDKPKPLTKKEKAAINKAKQAAEPPKPKKVLHPLAQMDKDAPSAFVMDTWKKVYSNCKGDWDSAMKQFWEMYDADGYSLWIQRFKYNDENEKAFMTMNATGGFVQRSGEIRKWLFGTMYVTGEEKKSPLEICGAWLIRGQDMQPLKTANDDAEHYYWSKVDHTTDEGKAIVKEMWCSDEYLEGKLVADCKVFK